MCSGKKSRSRGEKKKGRLIGKDKEKTERQKRRVKERQMESYRKREEMSNIV